MSEILRACGQLSNIVEEFGLVVAVDNKVTLEIAPYQMNLAIHLDKENHVNEIKELTEYYKGLSLDFSNELSREYKDYKMIEDTMFNKFKLMRDDPYSRRIYYASDKDDNCLAFVQFLFRGPTSLCILQIRSSDVIKKLPLDLFVVKNYINDLIKYNNLDVSLVKFYIHITSAHIYKSDLK